MISYSKSKKELIEKIQSNKEIKADEWDNYARENKLFSSLVLMFKTNSNTWEEAKRNIAKKYYNE